MPVVFGTFLIWLLLLLLLLLLFPSVRKTTYNFGRTRISVIPFRARPAEFCPLHARQNLLYNFYFCFATSNRCIKFDTTSCDNMLTLVNFCFVPYRYLFFTLLLCSYPYSSRFAGFETITAKRFLYKSCVLC